MFLEVDELCGIFPEETPGSESGDLKPEFIQYRDEGCARSKSCLDCPLPRCVYENRRTAGPRRDRSRDKEIRKFRDAGKTIKQLSRRFKVSERTIERVLTDQKNGADNHPRKKEK